MPCASIAAALLVEVHAQGKRGLPCATVGDGYVDRRRTWREIEKTIKRRHFALSLIAEQCALIAILELSWIDLQAGNGVILAPQGGKKQKRKGKEVFFHGRMHTMITVFPFPIVNIYLVCQNQNSYPIFSSLVAFSRMIINV